MQPRIWKQIYLSPFVRLNLYTRGFTISFGRHRIGWVTFGRRGIRVTLDTGMPGTYLTERRTWDELSNRNCRRSKAK
jgi:hypothetical protein